MKTQEENQEIETATQKTIADPLQEISRAIEKIRNGFRILDAVDLDSHDHRAMDLLDCGIDHLQEGWLGITLNLNKLVEIKKEMQKNLKAYNDREMRLAIHSQLLKEFPTDLEARTRRLKFFIGQAVVVPDGQDWTRVEDIEDSFLPEISEFIQTWVSSEEVGNRILNQD